VIYAAAGIWWLLVTAWFVLTLYRIRVWKTREGSVVRTCVVALVLLLPAQLAVVPGGAKAIGATYAGATLYGGIFCYVVPWLKKRVRRGRSLRDRA
jgi:hypothetical protein